MLREKELVDSHDLHGIFEYDHATRRYYDTVTWLSEVVPGSMRTPFEYKLIDNELYSSCNSPMGQIFDESIEAAKLLPDYEQRRRNIEKDEYHDMLSMMRGELPNTMVVISDFPPELMDSKQDVGGYNVNRKQTMLRVITKTSDNVLKMTSQSLDLSDRIALERIYHELGYKPEEGELLDQRMHLNMSEFDQEFLIDKLTRVYDKALMNNYGGSYYAGVRGGERLNTYDFVCKQEDLLTAYLAKTQEFTGGNLEYNLAAAIKARFNNRASVYPLSYKFGGPVAFSLAMYEMENAGDEARLKGEVQSGCGVSLGANSPEDQYSYSGYGNKSSETVNEDKFGPLKFKCKYGHWNERPRNKLIKQCKISSCKNSVAC